MVFSGDSLVPEVCPCLGTLSVDGARTYICIFKKITSSRVYSDTFNSYTELYRIFFLAMLRHAGS